MTKRHELWSEGLDAERAYSLYAVALKNAATLTVTYDDVGYAKLLIWPRANTDFDTASPDFHIDLEPGEQISLQHETVIGRTLAAGKSIALYCGGDVGHATQLSLAMTDRLKAEGLL
jgi:hypothetical protein